MPLFGAHQEIHYRFNPTLLTCSLSVNYLIPDFLSAQLLHSLFTALWN